MTHQTMFLQSTGAELPSRNQHDDASGREQQPLCSRCEAIDFEAIFELKGLDAGGKHIVKLGDLTAITGKSPCPLCSLFAAVRMPKTRKTYHLRAFSCMKMLRLDPSFRRSRRGKDAPFDIVLAVLRGNAQKGSDDQHIDEVINTGIIARVRDSPFGDEAAGRRITYEGRLVNTERVDYAQLRQWLDHCDNFHDRCKISPQVSCVAGKLIDCYSGRIVSMTDHAQYFALSYVWGTNGNDLTGDSLPSGKHFAESGTQLSDLPRTIEDAIEVVRSLGQRYLWVDRYCIDQDDSSDKHAQIQNMGKIYRGALATIVAVAGDDADYGLPGVNLTTRSPQPRARVQAVQLVSTLAHVSQVVRDSTWVSRAWTYQEAILSRRCLFFTGAQTYFVCQSSTACESMVRSTTSELEQIGAHFGARTRSGRLIREMEPMSEVFHSFEENRKGLSRWLCRSNTPGENLKVLESIRAFAPFLVHFQQYSRRYLSYESDSLNAMKGILSESTFVSYWGVPIMSMSPGLDAHSAFAIGLTWHAETFASRAVWASSSNSEEEIRKHRRRQEGMPTWSWVCLRRQVVYREPIFYQEDKWATLAKFYIPDTLGCLQDLAVAEASARNSKKVIAECSPSLYIESDIASFSLRRTDPHRRYNAYAQVAGPGGRDIITEIVGEAIIDTLHEGDLERRLESQEWEAILILKDRADVTPSEDRRLAGKELGYGGTWTRGQWLLIDWKEDTAYRIGILNGYRRIWTTTNYTRKTIKLE